jgi:hypothetical protein
VIWDDWARQRLRLIYEQQPVGTPDKLNHKATYVEEEMDLSGDEIEWTGSEVEKIDFSTVMYIGEMSAFLDAIRGRREYPKTFYDDKKVVDVLYELEADHGLEP